MHRSAGPKKRNPEKPALCRNYFREMSTAGNNACGKPKYTTVERSKDIYPQRATNDLARHPTETDLTPNC